MEATAASVVGFIGTDLIILFGAAVVLAASALRVNVHLPSAILLGLLLATQTFPLVASTIGIGGFIQSLGGTASLASVWALWAFVVFRLLTLHLHEESTLPGALIMGATAVFGVYPLWLHTAPLQSLYSFTVGSAWFPPESIFLWTLGALFAMSIAHRQRRWL